MTATYEVFGLRVESAIALPASLTASSPAPDVTLRFGDVPDALRDPLGVGVLFQASPGEFLFRMPGEATFFVRDGREIVVATDPAVHEDALRSLLLGSPFGALLHQRGTLVLHASVIVVGDAAIAVLGFSGTGKSTLAAACRRRGHVIYADDAVAVTFDEGRPVVAPGFQQIKLWTDSAEQVGETVAALTPVRRGMGKFSLPLAPLAAGSRRPLGHVYVLSADTRETCAIVPLAGADKLIPLIANTYRTGFLDGLGRRRANYEQCAALASAVPISRLLRPRETFRLDALVDLIEAQVSG